MVHVKKALTLCPQTRDVVSHIILSPQKQMQPLTFQELFLPKIWGGEDIGLLKGCCLQKNIGESFEISSVPGKETPVATGEFAGLTLEEVIKRTGVRLLGKVNYEKYGTDFPLLVKFISSAEDLSVQVHPGNDIAHEMGHPYGKNEMWYMVQTTGNAIVRVGFSEDYSEERYLREVADGTLCNHINTVAVHPGDSFSIPAGRIHSIGAGCLLIEIQQSSDDTFRVYDYNRTDITGEKRELHIDMARRALDYHAVSNPRINYQEVPNKPVMLLDSPSFTTKLCRFDGTQVLDYSGLDSFVIYVAFEGSALLTDSEGTTLRLAAGHSVMFPAENAFVSIRPERARFSFIETSILNN